jgi:hypothetical protein
MPCIRLKLCYLLIATNFFFAAYSQDSKVYQIDSIVNQIRKHSGLSAHTAFDSSWLKLPMGPRYEGRTIRKSYYHVTTGELKMVQINQHIYYYHSNQLIKVEWKPRRKHYIYYNGLEVIKNSIIDKPAEHWEAIQSVRRRATQNVDSQLRLGTLYLERFLNEKK